jgi:hypothetical protein
LGKKFDFGKSARRLTPGELILNRQFPFSRPDELILAKKVRETMLDILTARPFESVRPANQVSSNVSSSSQKTDKSALAGMAAPLNSSFRRRSN